MVRMARPMRNSKSSHSAKDSCRPISPCNGCQLLLAWRRRDDNQPLRGDSCFDPVSIGVPLRPALDDRLTSTSGTSPTTPNVRSNNQSAFWRARTMRLEASAMALSADKL